MTAAPSCPIRRVLTLGFVSARWRTPVFVLLGLAVGMAAVLFRVSNAASYLTNDAETCINCHIMVPQYATWARSSHKSVTVCVDCHVPHDNPVAQYMFKGKEGAYDAMMFTLGRERQVIRLSDSGVPVVQGNCIRCHEDTVNQVHIGGTTDRVCWDCHREVPHGMVRSLSATPEVRRPKLPPAGFRALRLKE